MNSLNEVKKQASMAVARSGIDTVVVSVQKGYKFIPAARYAGKHSLLLKKDGDNVKVYNPKGQVIETIETKSKKIQSPKKEGKPEKSGTTKD